MQRFRNVRLSSGVRRDKTDRSPKRDGVCPAECCGKMLAERQKTDRVALMNHEVRKRRCETDCVVEFRDFLTKRVIHRRALIHAM